VAESSENLGKGKKSTEERKAADMLSAWDQFLLVEGGFYPPRLAALHLGITVQAVYSASEKGRIRYFLIGRERFYSSAGVYWYRERGRLRPTKGTSTEKRKASDFVSAWHRFLLNEGGAYPPKVAGARLKITIQAVYAAADKGWLRYFRIGRERFYSARDVHNYRWSGARKFRDSLPGPQYCGAQDQTPEPFRAMPWWERQSLEVKID
jgi:hypothetical protein